jgi:hypothetical protein
MAAPYLIYITAYFASSLIGKDMTDDGLSAFAVAVQEGTYGMPCGFEGMQPKFVHFVISSSRGMLLHSL